MIQSNRARRANRSWNALVDPKNRGKLIAVDSNETANDFRRDYNPGYTPVNSFHARVFTPLNHPALQTALLHLSNLLRPKARFSPAQCRALFFINLPMCLLRLITAPLAVVQISSCRSLRICPDHRRLTFSLAVFAVLGVLCEKPESSPGEK